ncbi:MAG: sulfatase [Balneolaceae bacterium]|nr:sulfatase [Balneolaceae bacterium]
MDPKNVVRLTLIMSMLVLVVYNTRADHAPEKPNIIFILADDLGYSDINSIDPLGRTFYETPNIDRLGRQGMKFLQAYTNAANCSPTRAALVSGQYYPHQPIYHVGDSGPGAMIPAENAHYLPLDKITEAEMLKLAGYTTALIGKWHLGDPPNRGPEQQGYDINIGGYGAGNPGSWKGGYFQPNNNPYIRDAREGEYLTDYLTRKAVEFVDEHQNERFYLNLSYYTPHSPFQAPEHLVEKYRRKKGDRGHYHPTYAAMIENLDTNIGKIMTVLDELNLDENTVVIFYSDNGGRGGYGFLGHEKANVTDNAPLKGGKGTFYEGGIRVPLIIRWPAVIEPGAKTLEPVLTIDFYPTYLSLADVEHPQNYKLDGQSLFPLLTNPEATLNRQSMYWHFPGYPNNPWRTTPVSVVRSGPWKLMKFYETEELKLYNLWDDPGEHRNLADQKSTVRDRLAGQLEAWLNETEAPMPKWPDNE